MRSHIIIRFHVRPFVYKKFTVSEIKIQAWTDTFDPTWGILNNLVFVELVLANYDISGEFPEQLFN